MNFLLMLVGAGIFGFGAARQFSTKKINAPVVPVNKPVVIDPTAAPLGTDKPAI